LIITKLVTAAIIIDSGKVLLTRRGPSEKLAGFWEFPGGKVEQGESLQDCLERELKEELGIVSVVGRELTRSEYTYPHGAFTLIALESKIVDGDISLSVHDRAEWVEINNLLDYKLAPADIPIAKWIQGEIEHAYH